MYINKKINNSESTNIIHFLWIGYASTPNMLNKSEILQTTGKNKKKNNSRKCEYSTKEIENQLLKVDKINLSDLMYIRKKRLQPCSVGVELFDKATKHSYILKNLIKFLRIPFA